MKMMYVRIDLNGSLVTAQRRRIGRDDRIGTRDLTQNKGATKLRYIPFNWSTVSL
ncbi:hypothetical protein HanRHA438_MTg0865891 (mitochondrion) [Helianthus annuus]|nr:hypothetical protein HanRHA438_MTg0865891 [Helianthus annuus]